MKTHCFVGPGIAFAALALGSGPLVWAQRAPSNSPPAPAPNHGPIWEEQAQPSSRGRVQRFGRNAETFGMSRMTGRPVVSAQGEQLSTITDFLMEPKTGRVFFAILPSGGGAKGMTFRIVPISAFTGATEDGLTLRLDRGQWDRVGTLEEWQLKDLVTIDVDHQQRLSRQLGLPAKEIYDGNGPIELVRATAMRGQVIRSSNGQIGRVDDIVVDVTHRESAVVLTTDREFDGSMQRYVVPFAQLGTKESGTWVSRLRREDFTAADDAEPRRDEARRDERDDRSRNREVDPNSPAFAVQQTIDRSWARGRVDAVTEGSRLVLRGMVDTEQDRVEIERMAARAAPGVRIANQIAVRQR